MLFIMKENIVIKSRNNAKNKSPLIQNRTLVLIGSHLYNGPYCCIISGKKIINCEDFHLNYGQRGIQRYSFVYRGSLVEERFLTCVKQSDHFLE